MNLASDSNVRSLASRAYWEMVFAKKRVYVYLKGKETYFSYENNSSITLLVTVDPNHDTEASVYRRLVKRCDELVNGAHIKSSLEACLPVMRMNMDDE